MTLPPCTGLHELFDSIDPADHRQARTLCNGCPIIDACRKRLDDVRADSLNDYGPRGTWAGELMGEDRVSKRRVRAEEAMFTEDEARAAHARHEAGCREPRTVVGERVYNRRKKREQYARRRAA